MFGREVDIDETRSRPSLNFSHYIFVNPLSGSRNIPARCTPLDHLGFAETIKRTKYRSLNNIPNKAFTPFIMSVFGAFGQAAVQWLTDVGLYIHENCPWIDATSWKRKLVRNLAVVVQEENWSMLARGCKRISVRKLNILRLRSQPSVTKMTILFVITP